MKQCTGLWIVAPSKIHRSHIFLFGCFVKPPKSGLWVIAVPINLLSRKKADRPFAVGRAVDDKSAKSLLGESFRRQLKYDGIYSRVTFICSKTDDISITEAADSLGLEDEMAADWERMDAIDKSLATLKQNIKDLGESRAVYGAVINDADDAMEVWEVG